MEGRKAHWLASLEIHINYSRVTVSAQTDVRVVVTAGATAATEQQSLTQPISALASHGRIQVPSIFKGSEVISPNAYCRNVAHRSGNMPACDRLCIVDRRWVVAIVMAAIEEQQ